MHRHFSHTILLSLLRNNWMGLSEVLRSTTQEWPELRLNPATESGTQWERRQSLKRGAEGHLPHSRVS